MKTVQMAFIAMFLFVLVWSIWPPAMVEELFSVEPDNPFFEDQPCELEEILQAYDFSVNYPEYAHRGEKFRIITRAIKKEAEIAPGNPNCKISLELQADFENVRIQPNARLVQSLAGYQDHYFEYSIETNGKTNAIIGSLWVYIDAVSLQGGNDVRIPVFSIPIQAPIRSFFGLPVQWAGISSAGLLILMGLFWVLKNGKQKTG